MFNYGTRIAGHHPKKRYQRVIVILRSCCQSLGWVNHKVGSVSCRHWTNLLSGTLADLLLVPLPMSLLLYVLNRMAPLRNITRSASSLSHTAA